MNEGDGKKRDIEAKKLAQDRNSLWNRKRERETHHLDEKRGKTLEKGTCTDL